MRDPYTLPCGHTFCLRPCLLSHAKAITARCIHCHATFDVAELRPNYTIGAKLSPLSSQRGQEQDQRLERQAENDGECLEEVSIDGQRISGTSCPSVRCSTCRRPVGAKELDICYHCHHDICQQCREKHRDNFSLIVRVKLNALSRHRVTLKSHLEQLRGSGSSSVEAVRKSKGGIFDSLEDAVLELRMAASKSLDSATANLEIVDVAGYEMIGPLVGRITDLFVEVNKAQDVYASLERISSLQEIVAKKKSLDKLLAEAAPLEAMMKKLPPLPITQMYLSDRFSRIDQHLSDFNLVIGDGVLSLPRIFPRFDIGDQRTVASPNTTVGKSRVKLYVGGLRLNHTESQLRQHFAQYGAVTDCYIARDLKTNESRCYAFVTFREEAHATRALADCPHFIEGGPVSVKPFNLKKKEKAAVSSAKDEDEKVGNKGKESATIGGPKMNELRLHVGNLDSSTTQQVLTDYFSQYGTVKSVNLLPGRGRKNPQRFALVSMSTPQEVEAVLKARPHQLNGKVIAVHRASARALK
ncbi:unnamed protein product [Taenia asiatica]|uniref:RRM domain-containing protein n=1 Tax=Taenia asiatica TaxID=60517 RepID=A0A0R3WGB9_TAEAS|nr:unnamed protein product [Taenia asiatica]